MNDELFQELLASVKQGAEIMKGTMQPSRTFEFPETEVRALREQFGLSQDKFADLVGISVGTLRNWEQGRRKRQTSHQARVWHLQGKTPAALATHKLLECRHQEPEV